MIQKRHLRVIARLWFAIAIIAAGYLAVFSLESHAQGRRNLPPDTPQTGSGGGSNPGEDRYVNRNASQERRLNPENFIDWNYSDNIRREIEEGRRIPISGRANEAEGISDGLDDLNRVVAVQRSPKSGGTATVEEYIFRNPEDTVYRVKSADISAIDTAEQRAKLMNEIIQLIETRAKNPQSTGRTVMYVDNLPLLKGEIYESSAVKSIIQAIGRGADVGMILESDAATLKVLGEANPNFKAVTRIVEINTAEMDPIVKYLMRETDRLERDTKVRFTEDSLVEAARQAIRYGSSDPFNFAQSLLKIAGRKLRDEKAGSPTTIAEATQELTGVNLQIKTIQNDLQHQENPEQRARLDLLVDQQKKLQAKVAGLKNSIAQGDLTVRDLEKHIQNLKQQLAELGNGWGQGKARKQLDEAIAKSTGDLETMKNAKAGAKNPAMAPPPDQVTPHYVHIASSQVTGYDYDVVSASIETAGARLDSISETLFGVEKRIARVKTRIGTYLDEMKEAEDDRRANPEKYKKKPLREKPIMGRMEFGPTGTAKTDFWLEVAKALGMTVVTIDGASYRAQHTDSLLIGAPPGYVRSDEEGKLTGPVRKANYVLVLFDEATRMHVDVLKTVVFPVLDKGQIYDSLGNLVRFDKAIVAATSNAGEELTRMSREQLLAHLMNGVEKEWSAADMAKKSTDELKIRAFKWELKNNYGWDEAMVGRWEIGFTEELTPDQIKKIAHQQAKKLVNKMANRNIEVYFSESAIDAIEKMHDPTEGARSLLQKYGSQVYDHVYDLYLSKKVKKGEVVSVEFADNGWNFTVATPDQVKQANGMYAERRVRVQEALASRAAGRIETAPKERAARFFDGKYMLKNAVAKVLRRMGRG